MQISNILSQIDLGAMALPVFQRGYVWNRDQVRELMASLYKRFPVGSLMIWRTRTEGAHTRGKGDIQQGYVDLILDGQQRITSLYGVIRGKAPQFYERQREDMPFLGLYFNVESETFKFYSPLEMKDNVFWVSVTDLMQQNVGPFTNRLLTGGADMAKLGDYITRLNNVYGIQSIDLHIESVTGQDKNLDIVVEVFNKVNSGGTKLSKGDLALAKICANWPDAREAMQQRLKRWNDRKFEFDLDWLMRNITTVTTGQAFFSGIPTEAESFRKGLQQSTDLVDRLLDTISARLGLDHDRVLGNRYAFPVMTRYLAERGGRFHDIREQNKLLYWYIHSFIWGRYAGSTESALNQDLRAAEAAAEQGGDALDALIGQLRLVRGDLRVRPEDFGGNSMGARFYPMLYLLTRVLKARDWGNGGLELNANMLGRTSALQVHHIFPKARLRKHGYHRNDINAIANFCFLTQAANLEISDRDPAEYFAKVEQNYPGALASQWVPMDRELWKIERYREFLSARRELLAQAANSFLEGLVGTQAAHAEAIAEPVMERDTPAEATLMGGADEEEMQKLRECNEWVIAQGLPRGEELYELADPETSAPLAVIDLAWPRGLQEGLSQPIALIINEGTEIEEVLNKAGYRFFTNPVELCAYVERDILAAAEEAV